MFHHSFRVSNIVNAAMARLDFNRNGQINIAAHPNAGPRMQALMAAADNQWTPFDFGSTRGDGIVTRHELAQAIRDHVDLNNDNRVGPRERHWARINFGR